MMKPETDVKYPGKLVNNLIIGLIASSDNIPKYCPATSDFNVMYSNNSAMYPGYIEDTQLPSPNRCKNNHQ